MSRTVSSVTPAERERDNLLYYTSKVCPILLPEEHYMVTSTAVFLSFKCQDLCILPITACVLKDCVKSALHTAQNSSVLDACLKSTT